MRENGDIFDNPPKSKSSNVPENSVCTTNLIKCTDNFFSLSKDSKEPGSTCTQCNITFSDFQSKVNHTCMPYKCKICNTAFSFDFKLKMHKCNRRKMDKTENDKISTANSPSSLLSEVPDNENVSKKISKNCCRCGKKLSPRCHGIFCRNCKSTAHKNKKSTLICKSFSKCSPSSLSKLSSNEGVSNSHEIQDQIEACNQSTNIVGKIDDIAASSDVSDSHTSLSMNLHQKKTLFSMSEEITKKYNSNKEKRKYGVAFKKYSSDSYSDKHDILSLSSRAKKKRGVDTQSKGRKKIVSEVDNSCSISTSKSSTSTPSNNQTSDSSKLTTDCLKLVHENINDHRCKNLKICLTSVLPENSLESNKDSTSEIHSNSAKCNKLDNVPAEINDITLSKDISNDHEFKSLAVDEEGSFNISSKNSVNSESGPHLIESGFSECLMSGDSSCNNVPEISDKQKNSSSSRMNLFCKTRKVSIKKSKSRLNALRRLSLEEKRLDTDNPRKHLECDNFQTIAADENNVLIASLKSKGKASKRKFSSDSSYFKKRIYKGSTKKYKHKFSRKLSCITEESLTSLSSFERNPKKVSFAGFENCVLSDDSRCNETSVETSLKDTSEKGKKHIFSCKGTSEEALLTENSRTVSENTYSTTENRKQKTDHSNSNSRKGRYITDKINEKNMRVLSSHKNSAYSVSDDPQHSREKEEYKEKDDNVSESISFGNLMKALPENGIPLIKESVNGRNIFKCAKCNYVFQHVQRAADHARTCPFPKHKEKEPKLLSDFEYVCSLCYRHWSSVNGLYKHYRQDLCPVSNVFGKQRRRIANSSQKHTAISEKQNNCVSISNYICHYEKADKKHICLKCNFSCLSLYTFDQHQCERRQELMTKCIVEVKKLTKIDLAPFPNVTSFECPFCQEIFYDEMVYENHHKNHKNVGRNSEKSRVHTIKELENQVKMIFDCSRNYETVKEFTERVIKPLNLIFSEIDSENFNLNVSLSEKQLKLMSEATRNLLSDNSEDILSKKVFKFLAFGEDSSSVDDSDSRDSVVSGDTASSFDFHCKCKTDIDPNVERKPCLKCLSQFMMDKIKENSDSTRAQNDNVAALRSNFEATPSTSNYNSSTLASGFSTTIPNSFSASHLNEVPTPSTSNYNSSTLASGFSTTVPNSFSASHLNEVPTPSTSNYNSSTLASGFSTTVPNSFSASHLNEVPINNENSSVPSTSEVDKSSIQTFGLGQLTSNNNISVENAIISELEDQYNHLEQSLSSLKVLCFVPDTTPNVNEETFSGTKLPPKIKDKLLNHYKPVTIYKGIPELLKDIRLDSKFAKIVFFVDIQPHSIENEITKATSVSDANKKMLEFIDVLLEVAHRTILTSPLILDNETLDSIHNQHLKDSFPNFGQAKTCSQNNNQHKQSRDVRHLALWDLNVLMDTLIYKDYDCTVTFDVMPNNVTVIVDWVFDKKIEYDVYISRNPKQYICAACVEVVSLLTLIEHLTEVHKNTLITMYIL